MATVAELEKKVDALAEEVALLRAQRGSDEIYVLSDDERREVEAGLREIERGEYATEEEVAALWKRFGI